MKRKRILVSAYFAKNVGDDLFLKVLFERYPHVDWYLLTADKSYVKVFNSYPHVYTIPLYREYKRMNIFIAWCKMTSHLKKYDAFVMIGGSIFMEHKGWQDVYDTRQKLMQVLKKSNLASFIIGANFGPYVNEAFKALYEEHFTFYKHICFRDSYSYELFKAENMSLAPDAVFTLKTPHVQRREKCIGLAPIYLQNRADLKEYSSSYYEKLAQIIIHYVKQEHTVKLFSFCELEGDLKGISSILSFIPKHYKQAISIVSYTGDLKDFLHEFGQCSIMIGTRFHSLILGMKYGQRILPIIYSDKTLRSLSFLRGVHIKDIQGLNVTELDTLFFDSIEAKIFKEAGEQFSALDQLLTKNLTRCENTS